MPAMLTRATTATLVALVAASVTQLLVGDSDRGSIVSVDAAPAPVVSQSERDGSGDAGLPTVATPTPTPSGTGTPAGPRRNRHC